jgi:hypothetical protein
MRLTRLRLDRIDRSIGRRDSRDGGEDDVRQPTKADGQADE